MKKLKHNHTLTDFLKFGIFAILLLMPILIFVPNAFYYGFNEHAVAQEKTEQVPIYYESNEVNDINDIHINHVYRYKNNTNVTASGYTKFCDIDMGVLIEQFPQYSAYNSCFLGIKSSGIYLFISGSGIASVDKVVKAIPFDFVPLNIENQTYWNNYLIDLVEESSGKYVKEYQPLVTNMSITDSMSYAWDSVWQNDLFSWTSNNSIYTVINNMNTTLGIPSQARLTDYLTYITLFTVIYVIIDIIIGTFTMLTHLFNKEPK